MTEPSGGLFAVFEGIDGSGTTTQIERYASHLRALGRAVHVTREPSTGPVGSLIRLALTRRLSLADARQPETMALLFAADRLDHVGTEIEPRLGEGCVVLSDRYDLSSLVYQSVTAGGEPSPESASVAWIRELNRAARRPDVTLVVDVSPAVAAERRRSRGGPEELFDALDLQERLARGYADAERFVPGDRVVHVNGDADADTVAARIAEALGPFLPARAG